LYSVLGFLARHFSVPPLEYKNLTSLKKNIDPNLDFLNIKESYGKRPIFLFFE